MRPHPANRFSKFSPCGFIPAKTPLARALMPRQPYSAAVKSDGEERLHPLSPEGKRAWEKRWSPPYEGGTGWLEKNYSLTMMFQRNNIFPIIYLLHIRFGSFINL